MTAVRPHGINGAPPPLSTGEVAHDTCRPWTNAHNIMISPNDTTALHQWIVKVTNMHKAHEILPSTANLLTECLQQPSRIPARKKAPTPTVIQFESDPWTARELESPDLSPQKLDRFPPWAPSAEAWESHVLTWIQACKLVMKSPALVLAHKALAGPLTDPELLQAAREDTLIHLVKHPSNDYEECVLALLRIRPDVPFVLSRGCLDSKLPGKIGGYRGFERALLCLGRRTLPARGALAGLHLKNEGPEFGFPHSYRALWNFPPQAYRIFQSPGLSHIHVSNLQITEAVLAHFKKTEKPAQVTTLVLEKLEGDSAFFSETAAAFPKLRALHLNLRMKPEGLCATAVNQMATGLLNLALDRLQICVKPGQDPDESLQLLQQIGSERRVQSELPKWEQFSLVLPNPSLKQWPAVCQAIQNMAELGCPEAVLELALPNSQRGDDIPAEPGSTSSGTLRLQIRPGTRLLHLHNIPLDGGLATTLRALQPNASVQSLTLEKLDVRSPGFSEGMAAFPGLETLQLNIQSPDTAATRPEHYHEMAQTLLRTPLRELRLQVLPGDDLSPAWALLQAIGVERQKMAEAPRWGSLGLVLPTLPLAMQQQYHDAVSVMVGLDCPRLLLEVGALDEGFRDSPQIDQPQSPSRVALRERSCPLDLQVRLGYHALALHVMTPWVKPLTWLSDDDPHTGELPPVPCLTGFSMQVSGPGVENDWPVLERSVLMGQTSHVCASVVHQSPNLRTLEMQLGRPDEPDEQTVVNLDELQFALRGHPGLQLVVPITGGHNPQLHRTLFAPPAF